MTDVAPLVDDAIAELDSLFGETPPATQSKETYIKAIATAIDAAAAAAVSLFSSPQPTLNKAEIAALNQLFAVNFQLTLLVRDLFDVMPDWMNELWTKTFTLISAVNTGGQALTDANIAAAVQALSAGLSTETANRTTVDNAILTEERNNVANLSALINLEISNRTAVTNAILTEERNDVASLQGQINALATSPAPSVLPQAEAYTDAKVNVVENQVQAVGSQLTSGLSQITNVAIPAASVAATAAAVAQLSPAINALKTETDTCLAPLCDTVTPNASNLGKLGSIIKGLEGLVAGGLLAGLLAAAVEDPKGTADMVVGATGWMESLSVDLVGAVGGSVLSVG